MHTYSATIQWNRDAAKFTDLRYTRGHTWTFDGGVTLPASSSPLHVPVPYSDPAAVDPEEAYVAALASCHMLTFLYLAARRGFVVASYRDQATGVMEKNEAGKEAITHVTLAPHVMFAGEKTPAAEDVESLHHEAHQECYLANSVKTIIETKGTWEFA